MKLTSLSTEWNKFYIYLFKEIIFHDNIFISL